jgi:hypothetical protein
MTTVYTREDLDEVRTDKVREGDLLARGRSLELGGYTAVRVGIAGPVGYKPDWDEDVYRIEFADGTACQQPGRYPVLIVGRGAIR